MSTTVTDALDEAARGNSLNYSVIGMDEITDKVRNVSVESFKAGAKWQSQQSAPTPIKEVDGLELFCEYLSDNLRQTCHEYKDGKIDYRFVYQKIMQIKQDYEAQQPKPKEVDEEIEKLAEDAWTKEPHNDMDLFCDTFIKGYRAALNSRVGFGIEDENVDVSQWKGFLNMVNEIVQADKLSFFERHDKLQEIQKGYIR